MAAGRMNKVMLWAGRLLVMVDPVKLRSLSRTMVLAAVSCQTWAEPAWVKLVRLIVGRAPAVSCLLITMMVRAPSEERSAAKMETLSGFGPVALTLISPKPALL